MTELSRAEVKRLLRALPPPLVVAFAARNGARSLPLGVPSSGNKPFWAAWPEDDRALALLRLLRGLNFAFGQAVLRNLPAAVVAEAAAFDARAYADARAAFAADAAFAH